MSCTWLGAGPRTTILGSVGCGRGFRCSSGIRIACDGFSLRSGTHLNFQLIKAANDLGRSLRIRMEVSSYDALCLTVQAGLGIGIMPEGSAAIYKMDGAKVIRLDEPWASRELSVCVRSRTALSVAAGLFLEHLLEME
ncbi:LysR substrate-binding domain-containing protein [Pseudomonas sp. NFACC07-1]|uniref:LysR substrate-binding domain-containing protein n=1 Tax=Pseudomonas sp. NFACC07-1 TaxID=1566239 RepID=UPI0021156E54|nr:LysR substrate-binding domain-containing protein [Pseudomonas sp. NFACC07-1]